MKNNICGTQALRECTGCGICSSVCNAKAISIALSNDGFYQPIVDNSKCTGCGLCKKTCYKYDNQLIKVDKVQLCIAAVNKDYKQLEQSSSGGISRVLMEECIRQGFYVFACTYDPILKIAKSIIAKTNNELDQFYGSKYFQSYTSVGFDNILRDKTDQKYALFGTPCQIYAFSRTGRYRRNPQNYLLVDIFCHGCPSYNLWNSYLSYNLKKANCNSFESYAFRSKTYGWHEYSFDFINKGIKHSSKKINDPFVELFFGKDIMNAACYNCIPRSTMAYGDIRIGDYWGPRFDMDTKGVSAVIIKTSYGLDFLSNIRNKVSISDASFADIVASQTYGHDYQFNQDRREYLLKALRTNCDLDEIHVKYIRMLPLKMRSKRLVKAILKGCPNWAFFALKKLLHSI